MTRVSPCTDESSGFTSEFLFCMFERCRWWRPPRAVLSHQRLGYRSVGKKNTQQTRSPKLIGQSRIMPGGTRRSYHCRAFDKQRGLPALAFHLTPLQTINLFCGHANVVYLVLALNKAAFPAHPWLWLAQFGASPNLLM